MTEELKRVPAFQHVSEDEIWWLAENGFMEILPSQSRLSKDISLAHHVAILLRGKVKLANDQDSKSKTIGINTFFGQLPLTKSQEEWSTVIAQEDAWIYFMHQDHFPQIGQHWALCTAFANATSESKVDFSVFLLYDKMMALGKLSAGIAHELNNPAMTIKRNAVALSDHMETATQLLVDLALKNSKDDVQHLIHFLQEKWKNTNSMHLSLQELSIKEDEINEWLHTHTINTESMMADTFAHFNISAEELNRFSSKLSHPASSQMLMWMESMLESKKMVTDLEESAQRMHDLVMSVKNFSHSQQAEKQNFTIRHGIQNTLNLLQHKFKKNKIVLETFFQEPLHEISGYANQLNQVWTNLIDNAIDALDGIPSPKIVVNVTENNQKIIVTITDNGSGIPAHVQSKIFEPFFTTKPIGKGTGLGLGIVKEIVDIHDGQISVKSEPGHTQFKLELPYI